MIYSMSGCLLGSILRLFANLGGYNGNYWVLACGQAFIGVSVVFIMIISIKFLIFNTTQLYRDWQLTCVLSTVPLGFLIS
jgi:hypothetical protein